MEKKACINYLCRYCSFHRLRMSETGIWSGTVRCTLRSDGNYPSSDFQNQRQPVLPVVHTGCVTGTWAAFAIALARSVMVLLNQGKIMDTIVYYMGNGLRARAQSSHCC